ncbi:MAG: glycosyltransferase family 2 protein [Anaerolineae bacterium]
MLLGDLTAVVPTRNEALTVPVFLRSLPESVPLIVVDASQDATPEVVTTLRPRNTAVIRHLGSVSEARQLGAEAAATRWLLFSDADVAFAPGYFTHVARYGGEDVVYGPKIGRDMAYRAYYDWFLRLQRLASRFGVPAASGSNLLVRRSALLTAGGFDLRLNCNEDSELAWRMRRRGYRVRFAPDLVVLDCDTRRLQGGVARKMVHSLARCSLLFLGAMPDSWRRSDWGYWTQRRSAEQSTRPLHRGGILHDGQRGS